MLEWIPAWDPVYSQGRRERGLLHDSDGKSTHYCEFPTSRRLELKEYPDGQSDDCNIHENIYAFGSVPECRLLEVLASFLLAHALRLNQNVKTDLIEAFIRYDSPRSKRGALRGNGDHGNQRPKEIHSHISHLCSATDLFNNNCFEEMQDREFWKAECKDVKQFCGVSCLGSKVNYVRSLTKRINWPFVTHRFENRSKY